MKFTRLFSLSVFLLSLYFIFKALNKSDLKTVDNFKEKKTIIAHRGASGYLPEHTLASKALAYGQGADYLEQDLVLTKDDKLIVMHDLFLDHISDVASREEFKDRKKIRLGSKEPHYYVVDFTLSEIKSLRVIEQKEGFPARFPKGKSTFRLHSFEEEIEFIQGLNFSTQKQIGIYPEIKAPWFYQKQTKDLSKKVLLTLKKYGYKSKEDKIFLQSFDPHALQRIKNELFAELNMQLPLIQLIAYDSWEETFEIKKDGSLQNYSYSWMFQKGGMQKIASYADGIGIHYSMLFEKDSTPENIKLNPILSEAQSHGLKIHVYTFRKDDQRLKKYVENIKNFHEIVFDKAKVDGLFSDFPDLSRELS